MIRRLEHVGISVADLGRSIAFYRDLLGLEVVFRDRFEGSRYAMLLGFDRVSGTVALLEKGNIRIELFEFADPEPRCGKADRPVCDHGITHFCLAVENIEGEYDRLSAAGTRFHGPPVTFPGVGKAAYGRDPDGNVFELIEIYSPDSSSLSQ